MSDQKEASQEERAAIPVVFVGIDDVCKQFVDAYFGSLGLSIEITDITTSDAFEKIMFEDPKPQAQAAFCGSEITGLEVAEIAQMTRGAFPESGIFYLSSQRAGFDQKFLQKQGFTDAFLIPFDKSVAHEAFEEKINTGKKVYRSISLVDVNPDDEIAFDLYMFMPMNKKHVKMVAAGNSISEDQYKRLNNYGHNSVFVDAKELGSFYEYTAEKLKNVAEDNATMSETERRQKAQKAVRSVFSRLFSTNTKGANFTEGKQIAEDLRGIVKSFLGKVDKEGYYGKLTRQLGDTNNSYSHATNVSTYGALFAVGLGIGNPEEIAMAGLLHDLGEIELPPDIVGKPYAELDAKGKAAYEKHPETSIKIIQERRLICPDIVQRIIIQHHERFNGSGYPRGLFGNGILKEAQILAIADEFDEATRWVAGRPSLGPREALESLKATFTHDPNLVGELLFLFR